MEIPLRAGRDMARLVEVAAMVQAADNLVMTQQMILMKNFFKKINQ